MLAVAVDEGAEQRGRAPPSEIANAPPMTPVATTERVSRYTQNVSANHRNVLVTPVMSVLTSSRRKTAGIAGGRSYRRALIRRR